MPRQRQRVALRVLNINRLIKLGTGRNANATGRDAGREVPLPRITPDIAPGTCSSAPYSHQNRGTSVSNCGSRALDAMSAPV